MSDLRDKLLREDGIDPVGVSERELACFRTLLAAEQRRARRLSWLIQLPLWEAVLLLLALCVGEGLWDHLGIPFLAASSLAVILGLIVILAPARVLTRRLEQSRSRIRHLKSRLPEYAGAHPRGIPIMARKGERPLVFWPGVLLVVVLVSLIAVAVGNGLWLVLTGQPSAFVTAWQIVLGILLAASLVRYGLTRPLDELKELEQPNPLLWIAVPKVLTRRIPRAVRITALTCLLTILGIVVIASFFQGGSVYAKALNNLGQAQSIHAVGYGFEGGRPIRQPEIRHVRGVGTQILWQRGDRLVEWYDDGQNRYEYVQGNDYAVRRDGQGQLLPRELTEPLRYLQDARREASRDKTVDGDLWQCFRREDPNSLSLMWIDEAVRFRRYEEYRRIESLWQQEELVEITYDEPFELERPPELFERRGIRIINPAQALTTRYDLENALASTEVLGLTFAVHELHRCGDYLLITSSVRPTDESLQSLAAEGYSEPVAEHMAYGGFDLTSWWQRKPDGSLDERPYAIARLGQFRHKGMEIGWHALLPRARWPGQDEQLEVCVYVRTDDPLRRLREQTGLESRGPFRPLLTVDLPDAPSELETLGRDLYELGHLVTAAGRVAQDLFVSDASGVTVGQFQQRLETLLTKLRPLGEVWDRTGPDSGRD